MRYAIEKINGKTRNIHSFLDEEEIPSTLIEVQESDLHIHVNDIEQYISEISLVEREKTEILNWFQSTDYIPNKIITGEWDITDQRWVDYLKERQVKRDRLDVLNSFNTNI